MANRHVAYVSMMLNESEKQWGHRHRFDVKHQLGALIMDKTKLVVKGYNFHSFGKTQTCSCHAEMCAIYRHMRLLRLWPQFQQWLQWSYRMVPVFHGESDVREALDRVNEVHVRYRMRCQKKKEPKSRTYRLYSCRFLSNHKLSTSKPCSECCRWIMVAHWLGIRYRVYFSTDHGTLDEWIPYDCTRYIPKNTYF